MNAFKKMILDCPDEDKNKLFFKNAKMFMGYEKSIFYLQYNHLKLHVPSYSSPDLLKSHYQNS